MKKIFNCLTMTIMMAFLMVMSGCSSSSDSNVEALLRTVPQEASMIAVIDLERVFDKVGIESKDGVINIPAELKSAIGEDVANDLSKIKGISPDALVAFMHRKVVVLTGYISNQEAFKTYVSDHLYKDGGEWNALPDNLDVYENVAIRGDQFWIVSKGVSTDRILGWANTKENESAFAANSLVADLASMDKDVRFFYDVDRVMNIGDFDMEQKMAINMVQEMFVRDMAFAKGWLDFGKDEITAEINNYNSKFEAAEYVIEMDKINTSLVSKLPKNSNFVIAFGAGNKMWTTLCSAMSDVISSITNGSSQGEMFDKALNAIRGLDGTVIAGIDGASLQGTNPQMSIFVEAKDAAAARDVVNLISMFQPEIPDEMTLTAEDNLVKFSVGDAVDTGADALKCDISGKLMLLYIDGSFVSKQNKELDIIDYCEISCEKMDCMSARIQLNKSNHTNSLLTLLSTTQNAQPKIDDTIVDYEDMDFEDILR